VTMDVGNLLDEEYFEVLGYTLAGRNLMMRYRYSF
jgi:outer membrane receptor protein involved in Fe transport